MLVAALGYLVNQSQKGNVISFRNCMSIKKRGELLKDNAGEWMNVS